MKRSKLAKMRTSRSGRLWDASARARACAARAHFILIFDVTIDITTKAWYSSYCKM